MIDHLQPGLLQALEHTLEALSRTSDVFRTALDTMARGERFSDTLIAEYRAQQANIAADRQRMEELLRVLWSQIERQ